MCELAVPGRAVECQAFESGQPRDHERYARDVVAHEQRTDASRQEVAQHLGGERVELVDLDIADQAKTVVGATLSQLPHDVPRKLQVADEADAPALARDLWAERLEQLVASIVPGRMARRGRCCFDREL